MYTYIHCPPENSSVRCVLLKNGSCLHGCHIPDVDGWVPPYLTSSHQVQRGVGGQTQDVIRVGGVESLGVCGLVVDHAHCCYVVHYQSFLSIEQVLTTVITTVTTKEKLYITLLVQFNWHNVRSSIALNRGFHQY